MIEDPIYSRAASKTPLSPEFSLPALGDRTCRGCGGPLVGRQRMWCSETCRERARSSARADRREPAGTKTAPDQPERGSSAVARAADRAVAPAGRRDPMHRLVPEAVDGSRAPEAIQLARKAGLELDQWQEDVLTAGMATSGSQWASDEVVVVVPRQNGKTAALIMRALWGAALGGERLVLFTAHEFKTCREGFLMAKSLVETEAFERFEPKVYVANGKESIVFGNGNRLMFIARSRTSGRGFSPDCVVLDESFELDDLALATLKPSVSAAESSQLWFASSAPHDTSAVLRRLALKGRAGDTDRMTYLEWCADPDLAPGDVAAWKQANPALGSRIDLQTIASELDILEPADFARERLGVWSEQEVGSVFDRALWASLAASGPLETDSVKALAIDVSPARDRSAIVAAALLVDGRVLIEVIADDEGSSWVAPKVAEIVAKHSPDQILLDGVAQAQSLLPQLHDAGIRVTMTDGAQMTAACGGFLDAVLEARVVHRDDPVLNAAVEGAKQRALGDRWAWGRRTSRSNVAPLVAASLAHYAVVTLGSRRPLVLLPTGVA